MSDQKGDEFDGFAHIRWQDEKLCYSIAFDQPPPRLVRVAQAIAMASG
jgi:hypothetical protein